jgi:hypothetical protein
MALALRAASATYADLIADARLQGAHAPRVRFATPRRECSRKEVRRGGASNRSPESIRGCAPHFELIPDVSILRTDPFLTRFRL